MAVRRISDLPMLSAYYPNAQLSDCMMEVSYAKPNTEYQRIYQSFSANVQDAMLCAMRTAEIPVDALPKASNEYYGVVRIGNNINVNDGVIAVADASETTKGLIKEPPNCEGAEFLQYNHGAWKASSLEDTTVHLSVYVPQRLDYQIIDLTYPVGSLFIASSANVLPPGITGVTVPNTSYILSADVLSGYDSSTPVYKKIEWSMLLSAGSIWNVSLTSIYLGQYINGSLPMLSSGMTIASGGEHYHKIAKSSVSVEGSGHHANKTVLYNFSGTTSASAHKNMNDAGTHTHAVNVKPGSVYSRSDTLVVPTSYCVNIWKRTQ